MIDETGRKLQDKYRTDSLLPNRTTWTQIGHVRVGGKQDSWYLIARKIRRKDPLQNFMLQRTTQGPLPGELLGWGNGPSGGQ